VLGVDLAGDEVAVAAWDRRLRVYGTGVWTHRLDSEPNDVAFVAGGGALVAVTMDGALVRVAPEGGEAAWDRIEAHDGPAWTLAVAPDGGWIATAGADGRVRVWDAATGARRDEIVRHEGDVYGLAISPDGTRLASAGRDRTVRIHARAAP
jgi:WD40 repeat protein